MRYNFYLLVLSVLDVQYTYSVFWGSVYLCMIHVFWGECVSGPPDTHYILCTHTTAHVSPPRRARLPRPSPSAAGRLPAARLRLQVLVVVGRGVVVRVAEVLPRLHLGHVARALHLGLHLGSASRPVQYCMYVYKPRPRPQVCISCKVFRVFCVFTLKCVFVYDTCI